MNDITYLFKLAAEWSAVTVSVLSVIVIYATATDHTPPLKTIFLKQIAVFMSIAVLSTFAYMVFA